MTISPAQCRAARAALQKNQAFMAQLSGVSQRAIASFETEKTELIRANQAMLQAAFEDLGVIFSDEAEAIRWRRKIEP